MDEDGFPIILARGMIGMMPPPLLERGAAVLMRKMRRNHPDLFRNLAALDRTTLRIEPTDLPHRFVLSFGEKPPTLALARAGDPPANATLKGSLESLLALLEGRIDSDALFFTREIVITGDTSAVVALRNTLDRETIALLDEATSLFGPFARVGRSAVLRWEGRAERFRDRLAALPRPASEPERDLAAEFDALRAEIETLKSRLAKQEAQARRKQGVAA
jgi:predicted lipid carrier protein YhbT